MVKGIINAFDHMEFCFVIKLTTGGNRAVSWPPVIATRYHSIRTDCTLHRISPADVSREQIFAYNQ